MRRIIALLLVSTFLVASTAQPALARRQRGGVSGGAIAGIAIISLLLGYGIYSKSQVQQKDLDNERYSKDHDSAIAAARVLKPGEEVETDTNKPGHRRLKKTSLTSPEPRAPVDSQRPDKQGSSMNSEPEIEQITYSSRANDFGLDELERASKAFDSFGATSRERLAVLHVLEEALDAKQVVYTRNVLEEDRTYLLQLNRKMRSYSDAQKEQEVLRRLIRYLKDEVFGGMS